jgi:hypothetical protein
VRGRFGRSTLVRVDLAGGAVSEIPVEGIAEEAWPVWSHPRYSPDGRRIAALLHRDGRWRLVVLPAEGGPATDLGIDGAVTPPAWSLDGTRIFVTAEANGVWNLFELDLDGSASRQRTRVSGGAFSPAPSPDGRAVFFLEMTAAGVNLRRLDLAAAAPSPAATESELDAYPLLPPSRAAVLPAARVAPVPASRAYRLWETQTIRPFVNFGLGPDGNSVQLGLDADDVLGRLHGFAAGSMGDAAGPRGGALAAAYRGLPVELSAHVFSAIEKPGRQSLIARPEFDQERRGGYLEAAWKRSLRAGGVRIAAGGGATDVLAFSEGRHLVRALGTVAADLAWRRTRGRSGLGISADARGSIGSTDGASWRQLAGGLRLAGILPWFTLAGSAHAGDTRGAPSRFDVFAIGGAPSTVLPPGLDRNRIESPALPADVQVGRRFTAFRAELVVAPIPLVLYGEWLRAWSSEEPDYVRVAGVEVRLERLVPAEFRRTLTLRLGIARILSETPRFRSTRAYAHFVYRP